MDKWIDGGDDDADGMEKKLKRKCNDSEYYCYYDR